MTDIALVAALALVPVLLVTLLRVNGAIAFMSLCLGSVLVTWHQLDNLQTAVILGGAFFSLIFLLFTHRGHHEDGHKKKKHGKH
jgi:choline-glycine betaine transporter